MAELIIRLSISPDRSCWYFDGLILRNKRELSCQYPEKIGGGMVYSSNTWTNVRLLLIVPVIAAPVLRSSNIGCRER